MANLDPQTTADFWDAYITAAGAGAPNGDSLRRVTFAQRRSDPACSGAGPRKCSTS
jgi:hypothetical protein